MKKPRLDLEQMLRLYQTFGPENDLAQATAREQGRGMRLQNMFAEQTLGERVREQALRNAGLEANTASQVDANEFSALTRDPRLAILNEQAAGAKADNAFNALKFGLAEQFLPQQSEEELRGLTLQNDAARLALTNSEILAPDFIEGERLRNKQISANILANLSGAQAVPVPETPAQSRTLLDAFGFGGEAKSMLGAPLGPALVGSMGTLGVRVNPKTGGFDFSAVDATQRRSFGPAELAALGVIKDQAPEEFAQLPGAYQDKLIDERRLQAQREVYLERQRAMQEQRRRQEDRQAILARERQRSGVTGLLPRSIAFPQY
jgi:hypothetical protein